MIKSRIIPLLLHLMVFSRPAHIFAQSITTRSIMYSQKVRDSFEIYVSAPVKAGEAYDVVYYCDANLKSGKALRKLIGSGKYAAKADRTIFVGIGHIGNYHVLRRRDFILPNIKGSDTSGTNRNYGQTENFYQFLQTELIPKINAAYRTDPSNNTILGHSLGGLFAFYCLFKNDTLFNNFYALSPALWIDHYSIYNFNRLKNSGAPQTLYFSAGGEEVMNHIKAGTDQMNIFLNNRKYTGLRYTYRVHKNKTHNSQVEVSLDELLRIP